LHGFPNAGSANADADCAVSRGKFSFSLGRLEPFVGPVGCGLLAPATYNTAEYQAIHQAALDGDTVKLKDLLQASPQLMNVADYDKDTPLHLAAMHGHAEAATLLLDDGADINARNTAGMTALHLAAKQGFSDIVKVLLSHKPDLNIKDSRGWTPLDWAEKSHHDEIASLLLENGAHR
jgi:ankyrin repeat protein